MVFWKLLLAHVLTDFVLQPRRLAENKRRLPVLAIHLGVHFAVAGLILYGLGPRPGGRGLWVVLGLTLVHGALDRGKIWLDDRLAKRGADEFRAWKLFVADQALHLISIAVAAVLVGQSSWAFAREWTLTILADPRSYMVASLFVLVVVGGGYLTGLVCKGFDGSLKELQEKEKFGVPRAGKYIGFLERTLTLVAILAGNFEFIGFLVAAKSIARFPEIRGASRFAEYYIVGTLTSISIAIAGGLLLRGLL